MGSRMNRWRWIGAIILSSVVLVSAVSAGTVVSGSVSGTWDLSGSPYWVEGDLHVESGRTLTVEPGVEIRFRGPFRLAVNGRLEAVGTETDSILFTRDEPVIDHEWHGVRLIAAEAPTEIAYARIEYVRAADSYPEVRGGAIYCESCDPIVRHCLLQQNRSHNANLNGMGGGVACVSASPVIEHCVIRDNYADSGGGVCTLEYGAPIIRNNLIADNTAPSSGGGIYAGVRSSPVIENNVISGNRAYGWGGGGMTLWNWYAVFGTSKTVRNNVVIDNWTSAVGGGFYIRYDYSVLVNNTVADNTASGGGGGLYVLNQGYGDFPPDVRNFIIWGNTGGGHPAIYLEPSTGAAVLVSYSDVEGGWSGTGNIDAPPLFEDAVMHLSPDSPCIDAGDPSSGFDDFCFPPSQGTVRNDMGAYGGPMACQWADFPIGVGRPGAGSPERSVSLVSVSGWPNPMRSLASIRYRLPARGLVRLGVYAPTGRLVRGFLDAAWRSAGSHRLVWDGRDDLGRKVASGVYFYRLEAEGVIVTEKVQVLD